MMACDRSTDRWTSYNGIVRAMHRLEHARVRPGTRSFSAKSVTLAGRCRPGSVQSLRPDVQMSAHGSWIPILPSRLQHLWPSPPAIGWPWSSRDFMCELLRTEDVHLHTPALRIGTHFLLTLEAVSCLSSFKRYLKTFLSTRLEMLLQNGMLLQKNALYKFTVIVMNVHFITW